ncbi:hypothetical protein [uncultured Shewanella sp.]|uniref:hypothetical protein n=1 Tax=uncultured Shewanella sp. TaxID=173975 RepID=UPI00262C2F69|nr:hypothetical protein [uncultured Shewanella sp.]
MVKIIISFLVCIFVTHSAFANDALTINNIVYYQSNYDYKSKKEDIIAYVLKNDPCITVQVFPDGKSKRYCQMGESGLNLEKDSPTIYVTDLYVSPVSVSFTIAAPWNEQQCKIKAFANEINCKPTGH